MYVSMVALHARSAELRCTKFFSRNHLPFKRQTNTYLTNDSEKAKYMIILPSCYHLVVRKKTPRHEGSGAHVTHIMS